MTYDDELTELEQGTIYYLRVVAVFDVLFKRESEVVVFRTLEEGKQTQFVITLLATPHFSCRRTRILFGVPGTQWHGWSSYPLL